MSITKIFDSVKTLPLVEKLRLIELIFRDIREETIQKQQDEVTRAEVAEDLLSDYKYDEELIAFTVLDNQDFHEEK